MEGGESDKSLREKVKDKAKQIVKSLDTRVEKIPVDEIDERTVSNTILSQLGNRVRERLGQGSRWDNPFSIVDVLANMGYVALLNDDDYLEKFPDEYKATRSALHKLTGLKALELVPFEGPDRQKESMYYKVIDETKLKDIAEGGEIPETKTA